MNGVDERAVSIDLKELLLKFVSQGFNEIFKLLDTHVGEERQRERLMRTLNTIYVLGTKYRMAVMFNNEYEGSDELIKYWINSSHYEIFLRQYADRLYALHQELQMMMTQRYDIYQAIDILVGGCTVRLPRDIFPKQQKFDLDPAPFFTILDGVLKSKILPMRMPTGMRVRFRKGQAICTVSKQYRIYVSMRNTSDKLIPSKLQFLIPNYYTAGRISPNQKWHEQSNSYVNDSVYKIRRGEIDHVYQHGISTRFIETTREEIAKIFAQSPSPLMQIHDLMQRVILLLDFQRLHTEGSRNRRLIRPMTSGRNTKQRYGFWWRTNNCEFSLSLSSASINIELDGRIIGDARGMPIERIIAMVMRIKALEVLEIFKKELSKFEIFKVTIHSDAPVPYLMCGSTRFIITQAEGYLVCPDNEQLSTLSKYYRTWPALFEKLRVNHFVNENMNRKVRNEEK